MEIKESLNKEDIHIYSIDINIMYCVYGKLLQFRKGTGEATTFDMAIVDQEIDAKEGTVTIDFSTLLELQEILKDFEAKFELITKQKQSGRTTKR